MAAFKLDEAVEKKNTVMEDVVVSGSKLEEDEEKLASPMGEKTKHHFTINELENQGVIVDDDVIIQKLAKERQKRQKQEKDKRRRRKFIWRE